MKKDNPPYVNCPSCGKHQQTHYVGDGMEMKIGVETWLFDLNCECGNSHSFSDHYDKYNSRLTLRQWIGEIVEEKMRYR